MLVLTRKVGQKLVIGDDITVVVNRISGNRVSLGIEAPTEVPIMREELREIRGEFEGQGEVEDCDTQFPAACLTDLESEGGLAAAPR